MAYDPAAMTVRLAREDDALCLSVLATQVFLDTYATEGISAAVAREVTATYTVDAMAAALTDRGTRIEVAEHAGHLIGFAQTTLHVRHALAPPGEQAELLRLYVQEPFTARGVGSALLRSAEVQAAAHGATVLWLMPWSYNARALAFYARHAYADFGETFFVIDGEPHPNRLLAKFLN